MAIMLQPFQRYLDHTQTKTLDAVRERIKEAIQSYSEVETNDLKTQSQ
jgi:hypothetical protein